MHVSIYVIRLFINHHTSGLLKQNVGRSDRSICRGGKLLIDLEQIAVHVFLSSLLRDMKIIRN